MVQWRPPKGLLERFPFEDQLDRLLDKFLEAYGSNRAVLYLDELHGMIPKLPERDIPTPFGRVTLSNINPLPEIRPPALGAREKDIMKAAIAMDLASVVGLVPGIGDFVEEEVTDLYQHRLKELMTAKEYGLFERFDKINPLDSVAAMRAIIHGQRS